MAHKGGEIPVAYVVLFVCLFVPTISTLIVVHLMIRSPKIEECDRCDRCEQEARQISKLNQQIRQDEAAVETYQTVKQGAGRSKSISIN